MMDKPSIVSIIGQRVSLRKAGKEYIGLCPFHAEKTPSFTINEEKGVFHCFGCGVGGDAIRFIELIENVGFKDAVKMLGIEGGAIPRARKPDAVRRTASKLAAWLNDQHLKCGLLLRELSQQIAFAERIPDPELVASLTRECEILSDIQEDLQHPKYAAEFLESKDSIEAITQWAEPEALPTFPPLTDKYRVYLRSIC